MRVGMVWYEFAVQANVVCGPGGVVRMSIVPKTVNTGANFGLSPLLSAVYAAHTRGAGCNHMCGACCVTL
jgi:2-keto-3-deoxy-6-phosphogluconate aldolase